MRPLSRTRESRSILAGFSFFLIICSAQLQAQTSVRRVHVLGGKDTVEIEVEASERVVPETQVLTGPDRLVIDFPNTTPGSGLHSQSVYRGQVKDLRVGLFQSKPPVTRIVLDLNRAQNYQVFSGRTVIIKVTGDATDDTTAASINETARRPGLVTAKYVTRAEPIRIAPNKPLEVSFRDGLLAIHSNKATLSEVLFAIQQQTGADIAIAAGAEQERVVIDLGPGPAQEIVAQLLKGSKFNFLILCATDDPRKLERVVLSARPEGVANEPPPPVAQNDTVDDEPPAGPPQPMPAAVSAPPSAQTTPGPQQELKADGDPQQ